MSNGYILILKCKNVFNSNITKLVMFRNIDDAYEYGLQMEYYTKREFINSKEDSIKQKVIWASSKNVFPYYSCKIYQVSNDTICNIYQSINVPNNQSHSVNGTLLKETYKNLKMFSLI